MNISEEPGFNNEKIVVVTTNLFRYDVVEPPALWDSYFRNPEYNLEDLGLGHKNETGLFFFTDTEVMAHDLAKNAVFKTKRDQYYLTSLIKPITLTIIDLSPSASVFVSIDILMTLGVDVLTEEFAMFDDSNANGSLAQLRQLYYELLQTNSEDWMKRMNLVQKIKVDSRSNHLAVGLFGQLLTDFTNGAKFVVAVKRKFPDVDGYRWREHNEFPTDPYQKHGFTYCLFDASKLPAKQTEIINLSLNSNQS